jgi:phosphatidylinositol kinase/protein kinase (PI-3  family)
MMKSLRSILIRRVSHEFSIIFNAEILICYFTFTHPLTSTTHIHHSRSLTEFSGDSRNKEESARLLGHLIGASERLIKPYVEPILKALLPKLRDSSPRVASCVLAALGELAIVGGEGV